MMKMLKNPFFKNNLFLEYLFLLTEEDQYWLLYFLIIITLLYYTFCALKGITIIMNTSSRPFHPLSGALSSRDDEHSEIQI